MRLAAYLSRSRHGVFYFRWPIPARLHPSRKPSHVRLSLGTRCPATAKRLSRSLAAAGQGWVDSASHFAMRYDELRQHVQEHFRQFLRLSADQYNEAGPLGTEQIATIEARRAAALEGSTQDWLSATGINPDALIQRFCERRGIAESELTPAQRPQLVDLIRAGMRG